MNTAPTITELQKAFGTDASQHREFQALLMAAGIASMDGNFFSVTLLGQDLYNHGISKI